MSNEVINQTSSISLDWRDYAGATKYQIEVSTNRDFDPVIVNDATLASSAHSFVCPSGEGRFFWRWRPYTTSWLTWSEVNSFIVASGAAASISLSSRGWLLIDKDTTTDQYEPDPFPRMDIIPAHFERVFQRNLAGDLLSEHYETKDTLIWRLEDPHWIDRDEMNEILRFFNKHTSFYIANREFNGDDETYNAWEVEFQPTPDISKLASGRVDLMTGELVLEEV